MRAAPPRVAVLLRGVPRREEHPSKHRSRKTLKTSQREFCAFSENGLAGDSCKSMGEAITKVESSGMIAFAKFPVSHPRPVGLDFIDRSNFDIGFMHEEIELSGNCGPSARFEYDSGFNERGRGQHFLISLRNQIEKTSAFGFVQENCDERRSINDHGTGASSRKSSFVVTQNFVLRAMVEARQRVDAGENFVKLLHPAGGATAAGKALEALFEGNTDGFGEGFAGLFSDLACEEVGAVIFDVESHYRLYTIIQILEFQAITLGSFRLPSRRGLRRARSSPSWQAGLAVLPRAVPHEMRAEVIAMVRTIREANRSWVPARRRRQAAALQTRR